MNKSYKISLGEPGEPLNYILCEMNFHITLIFQELTRVRYQAAVMNFL